MLAKLPFRSKLILVASIPLLALAVFAGATINGRLQRLDRAEQYGDIIGPYLALTSASRGLSDEAVASAWYINVREGDPPASKQLILDSRNATDRAVKLLRGTVDGLDGRVTGPTERAVRDALARLEELNAIRAEVDTRVDRSALLREIGRASLDASSRVARDTFEANLSTGLASIVDLRRQQAAVGDEAAIVMTRLVGGPLARGAWVAAITEQDVQLERFLGAAGEVEKKAYAAYSADSPSGNPVRSEEPGEIPTELPASLVTPEEYEQWYSDRQARLDEGVGAVQTVVNDEATSFESSTRTQTLLVAGLTALVIIIVLGAALIVVRSVNRPLRALTRAARDVSERRLPLLVDTLKRGGDLTPGQLEELTPIDVASRDEIGELARAFNTIQQVTVAVAEEQSELLKKGIGDLYVNLARRNQSLLDRQISLLDDMEATVEDPDELGSLFELDHLATRMRRNAESLLVMSGAEQPRQWGTSIPVLDVMRAAAAEIADFPRVSFYGFEGDVTVTGNAVADVTHLLAELLENAAAFSPPETPVVVAGQAVDRRFVITITDEGIGMDDERLQRANTLLARPPAPGLALARTLGLYVVGHLASRHGIHVQVRRATGTGLTAVVVIPAMVLARSDDADPASEPATPREAPVRAVPVLDEPAPSTEAVIAPPPPPPPPAPPVTEPVSAATAQSPIAWRPGEAAPSAPPPASPAPVAPQPAPPTEPGDERLTRRVPASAQGTNGEHGGGNGNGNGLTSRVPGTHLTHQPVAASTSSGDVRPRPERVHDMLSRHERGKRDGRVRAPDTAADANTHEDGRNGKDHQ